jgi:hypothetical protein
MCIFFQVEAPLPVADAWGIATLNIGADGIPDFVVADGSANQITALVSDGIGGFASQTTYATGAGTSPEGIAVGDFNDDGHQDVVTADSAHGSVSVFLSNGSGGFDAPVSVGVGTDPTAVATADVNGDGKSDIIVANTGSNNFTVLTSTGGTTFTSATYALGAGTAPTAVATANLNADTKPDLIVADGGTGAISVLLNSGTGAFGAATTYAVGSASSDPLAVTTAALNGGTIQDVIVANGNGTVAVLINNGSGTLAAAKTFLIGTHLTAIATGNFDNTGTPDILVADSANDSVDVLAWRNSTLVTLDTIQFAAAVASIAVADVNDDGRPDIVATLANGQVDVVLNQSDYTAAGAIAAYAANPSLAGMTVADTGANISANFNALQTLAAAGALVSVTDANGQTISLRTTQFLLDDAVVSEIVSAPITLNTGPLNLTGSMADDGGAIFITGTLANTGTADVMASGGALDLTALTSGGVPAGRFVNNGLLTVAAGYQLTIQSGFANQGAINVGGAAELAVLTSSWANSGSILINAATLKLGGTLGIGQLGSIVNTNGIIDIVGVLDGPGTLSVGTASPLGTVDLEGTIANATIVGGGSGLEFIGSTPGRGTATLQGVTYRGPLQLNQTDDALTLANSVVLTLAGGTGAGFVQLTGAGSLLTVSNIATLNSATIDIGSHDAADPAELYAQGRSLTLGATLSIVQVARAALLDSDRLIGDGIVNGGHITADINGGVFAVQGGDFTNSGALTVSNGDTFEIETDREGNIAGGTLSGGAWSVGGASTLRLTDDANILVDATSLTLTGTGAAAPLVQWFSSASQTDVTLQQTLRTVAASGTLDLAGAWTFASTAGGGINVLGTMILGGSTLSSNPLTIDAGGTLNGFGTVTAHATNDGTVTANSGLLDLTSAVTGTGTMVIGAGATLEFGTSAPSSQLVTFAAATGELLLNAPTLVAVGVSGFVLGDTIDLHDFVETGDSYNVSTGVLTMTGKVGGGTGSVALTFLGSYTQGNFTFASDNAGGTLLLDPPTIGAAVASVASNADLTSMAGVVVSAGAAATASGTPSLDPVGGATGLSETVSTHGVVPLWPTNG